MATIFSSHDHNRKGYARRISTHLAFALIAFCLLQIVIVARMGGAVPLHLGVILAIGAFAVVARDMEHRWHNLDNAKMPRSELAARFRREVQQLWAVSLFGAMLWVPVAYLYRAALG